MFTPRILLLIPNTSLKNQAFYLKLRLQGKIDNLLECYLEYCTTQIYDVIAV